MKKILYLCITLLFLTNISVAYAIDDSGFYGNSNVNATAEQLLGDSIENFNYSPVIRVTAVGKNGNKIANSYSVDYYTKKATVESKIYYKGYKFNENRTITESKHNKKLDDFFGLTTSDNYSDVVDKVQKALMVNKTDQQIIDMLEKDLKVQNAEQLIKNKELFIIIEPVFQIKFSGTSITGTSSELLYYLMSKYPNNYSYNLHYGGTLSLFGQSLLVNTGNVSSLKQRGFSYDINIPGNSNKITQWTNDLANQMQSKNSGYGLSIYYATDIVDIPNDIGFSCISTTKICDGEEINIKGLTKSVKVEQNKKTNVFSVNCILNNPKYNVNNNTYCSATIYSNNSQVTNRILNVDMGRFVAVNNNPNITITWECYSKTENGAKQIYNDLTNENDKMVDIKYSVFDNTYVYKNIGKSEYYSQKDNVKTEYGMDAYRTVVVLNYKYSLGYKYLNKWIDKLSATGSGNSLTIPNNSHQYNTMNSSINFSIPYDKNKTGTQQITVSYDLESSKGIASSYLKKYLETNVNGKITVKVGEDEIKINNSNTNIGSSSTYSCPLNINVKEMEYIYRPIDLNNPFPGKDGQGRNYGANWNQELEKKYITDRQDAYEQTPMYSVILDSSKIKQIRDYNKNHQYSDFNLLCDNGNSCYSEFLRNNSIKILEENKSTCYNGNNRTTQAFNNCGAYDRK